MEPIHLPVREVALAAKKAYDEGRLSAQHRDADGRSGCFYRDAGGFPCAIGAFLDTAAAKRFDLFPGEGTGIDDIVSEGGATTDDLVGLSDLQEAHDWWRLNQKGEDRFVAVLQRLLTDEAA